MNKITVYSREQETKIQAEFSRLKDICYLDHAGAACYSEKQIENLYKDLSGNIYGNPHSRSTTSQLTGDLVDIVRYRILNFFNTTPEEYSVVFTSGATQSLKLLAESFNFNGGSLVYLEDNHTSVLGMRALSPNFQELKVTKDFNILSNDRGPDLKKPPGNGENCLFVYPAQSNFAGTKYPLSWIDEVKNGKLNNIQSGDWFTLLDAASFVSTNQLDLTKYHPDFVVLSFYKIFGYPTGLGALLIRRNSEHVLNKIYFGGGTVLMALSSHNVMIPRPTIYERFEDGTIPYLSILALIHGFDTLRRLNLSPDLISSHTFNIARYVFDALSGLYHSNGETVAVFYHETNFQSIEKQGGIINFNLKRSNGEYVGYAEVLHIANLHGIQLRTGCFCNPGACQRALKLTKQDVQRYFQAGHVCGDQHDLVDGYPTGSVRISFGYMSTYEDADKFLRMIEECFVLKPILTQQSEIYKNMEKIQDINIGRPPLRKKDNIQRSIPYENIEPKYTGRLMKIYLYPIKSCGAFEVQSWKLTNTGLEYDRRWMIVNGSGSCMSQKHIKNLCMLKPVIDLKTDMLELEMNGSKMRVPLQLGDDVNCNSYFCDSKVCGDKVKGYDCGDGVAGWLSINLGQSGLRLLRQIEFGRHSRNGQQTQLSLANKAEYLLINWATLRWLQQRIPVEDAFCHSPESILRRFRANFVVDFAEPFVENDSAILLFNEIPFKFSGHCTRCQMICIDQETGEISKEPLKTLSKELKGKMQFGIYLSQYGSISEIQNGCSVLMYTDD